MPQAAHGLTAESIRLRDGRDLRTVVAAGQSNHYIPWQQPELLAEEILRVSRIPA